MRRTTLVVVVAAVAALLPAPALAETITGTFTYGDLDPSTGVRTPMPIANAKVEIHRCVKGIGGLCIWGKARDTETDANGAINESFSFVGEADYAVKVFAENDAVSVWPFDVLPHTVPFHQEPGNPGANINLTARAAGDVLDFTFPFMDDWSSRHYNVAATLRLARQWVDARRGDSDVLPRAGADDWSFTSFYNPVLNTISLNASDVYEDTTLLHEYAHHLEHTISSFYVIPSTHNGCTATLAGNVNSNEHAWMEGFADWFARAVERSFPTGTFRELAPGTPFVSTLEAPSCPGLPAGITPDAVENVVAGALWDLTDPRNEPFDRLENFEGTIFRIFDNELDTNTDCIYPFSPAACPDIHDFRRAWMGRNLPGADLGRIWSALGIPFVDDFPPLANAGLDRSVREGAFVTLNGGASEDPELGALTFSWTQTGGPAVTVANPTSASPSFTAPYSPGSVLTFRLVVNDGVQSSGPDFVTVTIVDGTPPVLSVPGGIVAEATAPNGAAVSYSVSATDNVDPSPSVTCSPASGSVFPLGSTTVRCLARDAAGNSSVDSFVVSVVDTTPPAVGAVSDITVEATSPAGAVVVYALPSALDLVDLNPLVECYPPSGQTFALGATTVGCIATDDAGNRSAPARFRVNVVDTTAPVLSVSDLTVNATSPAGAVVSAYPVSASDIADPAPAISCAPAAPSTFAVGTTTVTCTAQDASGNTSAPASFVVTVKSAAQQTTDLLGDVQSAPLPGGTSSSLQAKLANLSGLPQGARCGRLAAFINEVQALAGGSIPIDVAERWIADAERIRAALGC